MSLLNRKARILVWAPLGSGTHYWGPGISAYNLLRLIDPEKYEVHLAHGFENQADYPLFKSQSFIRKLIFKDKVSMVLFLIASKKWLRKNASSFDVMYCLSPHHIGILPSAWFKRFGGKKSFIKMTALNDGFNDNSFISRLFKLPQHRLNLAKEIDGFISLSKEIVEEIQQVGIPQQQIFKIPNGVNTDRFQPAAEGEKSVLRGKYGLGDHQFVILFTGGISRRKGPSLVISAVAPLIKEYPELMVLIIGPDRDKGLEYEEINRLFVSNPALKSHVQLLNHLPNPEEYYRAADLFVLPSLNEGMSNSVLEALASGLPAIVTPVSGSEEMVEPGVNGYIVNRSVEEIKEAILKYLTSSTRLVEHSISSRHRALEYFDAQKVIAMHEKLFSIPWKD